MRSQHYTRMNNARSLQPLSTHFFALLVYALVPLTAHCETGWDFMGGQWSQNGATVSQTDAAATGLALKKETREAYSTSAKLRFKPSAKGAAAGLLLQAADANNYLLFVLEQKKAGLYAVLKTRRDTKKSGYSSEEGVGEQEPSQGNPVQCQERGV